MDGTITINLTIEEAQEIFEALQFQDDSKLQALYELLSEILQ